MKTERTQKRILFVPCVTKGNGIGHLRRCLDMAQESGAKWYILFPAGSSEEINRRKEILASFPALINSDYILNELKDDQKWYRIILDKKTTTIAEFEKLSRYGPVIGIDEGGASRPFIPYLIDTLPLPPGFCAPNLFSTGFLKLPDKKREFSGKINRVLLTFGGEDPQMLSERFSTFLIKKGFFRPAEITVVIGPLFNNRTMPHGINIIKGVTNLGNILYMYDLVFTSFGLTPYEAVSSGVPVILLNPSRYHRILSKTAGFPEIGVKNPKRRSLLRILNNLTRLTMQCRQLIPDDKRSFMEFIQSLDLSGQGGCPVCKKSLNLQIERFEMKTFLKCSVCGMVYRNNFKLKETKYNKNYFFTQYKNQYGKTYLQDFNNIRCTGRERIKKIQKIISKAKGCMLLDVGCAYGPFLSASQSQGIKSFGLDICSEAVEWVKKEYGIPSVCTSFEEFDIVNSFNLQSVDILTMWYVIEHFKEIDKVLKKVNRLLKTGGIFAFSTPNLNGISGRKNLREYLSKSPFDHYTIWDPASAKTVLKRYGFRVRRIYNTGHHPERFPIVQRKNSSFMFKTAGLISKCCNLGETFEVYAEKRIHL